MHEERDRQTIVVTDRGSNSAVFLAVLLVVVLLVAGWWFLFGPGSSTSVDNGGVDQSVPTMAAPTAQPTSSPSS